MSLCIKSTQVWVSLSPNEKARAGAARGGEGGALRSCKSQ